MASMRSRPPATPEGLHAALGAGHPLLFEAMHEVFPGVDALLATSEPPAEVFRGTRCLACGKTLGTPESLAAGTGPECRRK
jgi:hypothetical protein